VLISNSYSNNNNKALAGAGLAGSEAITYGIQDEVLRKKLLMELRNGVHREKHTYRLE
jgi:hypothetical protein